MLKAAAMGFAVMLAVHPAAAELTFGETTRPGGVALLPQGQVRLTCWQNGTRIIDQRGDNLSLAVPDMVLNRVALGETMVFAAGRETTCRVKPQN